ncbi:hypothetical protein GCM10009675_21700 [Prauserella alba]|uniref:Uncharacterized protein n=1 Tax=Prauserella alba TaxID=176898 RepID=A0ABN1VE35_9PSEU
MPACADASPVIRFTCRVRLGPTTTSGPVPDFPTVEAWAMRNRYAEMLGFLAFMAMGIAALVLAIVVGLVISAWSLLL